MHEGEKQHLCNVCGKTFLSGLRHHYGIKCYALKCHIMTVHFREQSNVCSVCDNSFGAVVVLQMPIPNVHGRAKKNIARQYSGLVKTTCILIYPKRKAILLTNRECTVPSFGSCKYSYEASFSR
jgi:hypothetical protein